MCEIGYYDFGQNLKLINFNGWVDNYFILFLDILEFWLCYWFEVYCYILDYKQVNVVLFCFDSFSCKFDLSLCVLVMNLQLLDIELFVVLLGCVVEFKIYNIDISVLFDELMNVIQVLFECLNVGVINLVL